MIPGIVTRFCSRQLLSVKNVRHFFSEAVREKKGEQEKMLSWQIHAYGNLEELQLSQQTRIPYITNPDEVLIKVHASSMNPIDVEMISGFGSTALNLMRKMDNVEFPLTLGRDFSGTVVSKGLSEANEIPVGAAVWGVVPVHQQGCHAEYVIVDRRMISEKPKNLDMPEAASTLYAGLTAYSALKWSANLNMENMSGLRALVLGASGGVGTSAVQLLHYGSAKVTATCASDAVPMVEGLGADLVLDYTDPDFEQKLCDNGRYDLILDCAGLGTDYATKMPWEFRTYVTLTTPVLKNLDKLGLFRGVITSASDILCPNIEALKKGRAVKWAYFVPTAEGIDHIYNLVTAKKMRPIVQQIYKFNETPEAYKRLQKGHLRGKIVIDISG